MSCYHLIANPIAGRGRGRHLRPRVEAFFEQLGKPLVTHITDYPGHATEIARTLPAEACVLSLGGDGTLHEVALACIGSGRTVGVLPAGSGDDFAFALGVPRHSLEGALQLVAKGHVRHADTGTVNGTPFVNSLGIGFDAEVAHAVYHSPSIFRGISAYLYGILQTLSRLECPPVTVELDDVTFYQGPALLVTTQNGPSTAGGFLFAPEASLFDGELDIIVAGLFGRLGALKILPKVMKGRHLSEPRIHLRRAKRVRIAWHKPRPGHMEGELLAAARVFDICVKPASLRVFAPPQ